MQDTRKFRSYTVVVEMEFWFSHSCTLFCLLHIYVHWVIIHTQIIQWFFMRLEILLHVRTSKLYLEEIVHIVILLTQMMEEFLFRNPNQDYISLCWLFLKSIWSNVCRLMSTLMVQTWVHEHTT